MAMIPMMMMRMFTLMFIREDSTMQQVHDDGHTADLIDDEHHGAQHAQELAVKAQLQVVVGGINVQLAVMGRKNLMVRGMASSIPSWANHKSQLPA